MITCLMAWLARLFRTIEGLNMIWTLDQLEVVGAPAASGYCILNTGDDYAEHGMMQPTALMAATSTASESWSP